jgi:hypothetical protein
MSPNPQLAVSNLHLPDLICSATIHLLIVQLRLDLVLSPHSFKRGFIMARKGAGGRYDSHPLLDDNLCPVQQGQALTVPDEAHLELPLDLSRRRGRVSKSV